MKKLRRREEETCPRSNNKSVEGLRLDLWSSRFSIRCSPFCWRAFGLMEFALPDVHSVLGDTPRCLFYSKAALSCPSKMDPLRPTFSSEYLHWRT